MSNSDTAPDSFTKELRHVTVIGIVGHRDLRSGDEQKIRQAVHDKLRQLRGQHTGDSAVLVSALAAGADQLAVEEADQLGIPVWVLLPMPLVRYRATFLSKEPTESERASVAFLDKWVLEAGQAGRFAELPTADNELPERGFERLSDWLTTHSNHLLALWDGVETGLPGGTSDSVRMAFAGQHSCQLHQLVTPRQKNPFPIGRRLVSRETELPPKAAFTWTTIQLPRPSALAWEARNQQRRRWRQRREIILKFAVPAVLATLVIGLGTVGFHYQKSSWEVSFFRAAKLLFIEAPEKDGDTSFWIKTARWLGVGLAVWAYSLALYLVIGPENYQRLLFWFRRQEHRIFGDRPFSLVIGLSEKGYDLAQNLTQQGRRVVVLTGEKESPYRDSCLNRGIWLLTGNPVTKTALRKAYFDKAEAVYVMGNSDEENSRVVQEMDELSASVTSRRLAKPWFVHLRRYSQRVLLRQTARCSIESFSVVENTARRLLTRYPIDRFSANHSSAVAQVIILGFGPLGQAIARACLRLGHYRPGQSVRVTVYYTPDEADLYRRFERRYPVFFPAQPSAFSTPSESKQARNYTFFSGIEPATAGTPASAAQARSPICFQELPQSMTELINPDFSLYQLIRSADPVSVYGCFESGLEGAALLSTLLPRLDYLKQRYTADVQTFCFYNFPDQDEEAYSERQINRIAPALPVIYFGNYLQECSDAAIRNRELDHLARQLAFWYYVLYDFLQTNQRTHPGVDQAIETHIDPAQSNYLNGLTLTELTTPNETDPLDWSNKQAARLQLAARLWYEAAIAGPGAPAVMSWADACWLHLAEIDRESNRQAADHLWVKLRQQGLTVRAGRQAPDFDALWSFWSAADKDTLGELEHRRWCAEKLIDGWLTLPNADKALFKGEQKEQTKRQKLHLHLRPFENLPESEQDKDHTQIMGIPFFLLLLGRERLGEYWHLDRFV